METILIVDDDSAYRSVLSGSVTALGHRPVQARNSREAKDAFTRESPRMVFLDLHLGGEYGLDLLREWRSVPSPVTTPVVVLTAFADSDNTIEAITLGAFDHLTKPVSIRELEEVIERAFRLQAGSAATPAHDPGETTFGRLIGESAPMRELQKLVGRVAASDTTVVITGETGTGKEEVARALHRYSRRGTGRFVAVNCAAIPSELLESELFGHVKGAFTGAIQSREGRFREAHEGTMFLDEIGDMALSMQAKLLRVLQERTITAVGDSRPQRVDVRVIAATHRDLSEQVRSGSFREDLFYRLHVMPVHVPPLRHRGRDIVLLAEHFLRRARPECPKSLTDAARDALVAHPWPGNVRELRNVMERLDVLVQSGVIDAADLPFGPRQACVEAALPEEWFNLPFDEAVARFERLLIQRALAASGGNKAEAARRLGIHRQLLYAKLEQPGAPPDRDAP